MDILVDAAGHRHPVPGGGPFNTLRVLARLRIPAVFLGRLSTDVYGQQLAEVLISAGASLDFASRGPEPSTVARAMLPTELGPDIEALHIGTVGLVLEPMATTLVESIRRQQGWRLVMLDPNIRTQLISDRTRYRCRLVGELIPVSTIVKASEQD